MKIKVISIFLIIFMFSNLKAIKLDYLSGDARYACEAILCLASPIKPPECSAAIARYFAIKFKKPWRTIQARKNFLNLCPVDASNDPQMYKYKNDILVNLDGECSIPVLNNRIESTVLRTENIQKCSYENDCTTYIIEHYGYRINPQLTNSCRLLASSKYTDYRLKYTCDTKFYEKEDWERAYELKEVSQELYKALPLLEKEQAPKLVPISYAEFIRLPIHKRTQRGSNQYYRIDTAFYQKIIIKKDCWVQND